MQRLIYHGWLNRESLPRDNRSHAPDEVRSKCLDLSSFCIAEEVRAELKAEYEGQINSLTQQLAEMTANYQSVLARLTALEGAK